MLPELVVQYGGLVGIAALFAILINLSKIAGWVTDGTSQTWSALLNLVGFVAFVILRLFKPEFDFEGMDAQAAALANVAAYVIAYVLQLLSSKATAFAVRDVPLIGKSFSAK